MARQFTLEQRRKFAEQTGVDERYLYQCLTGRRDMNPGRAREIEKQLRGALTRIDLCQKTWRAIWPELERRTGAMTDTGERRRETDGDQGA